MGKQDTERNLHQIATNQKTVGILQSALESYGLDPDRVAQFIRDNLETSLVGLQARELAGDKNIEYYKQQMVWNEANILLQVLDHEKATTKPK